MPKLLRTLIVALLSALLLSISSVTAWAATWVPWDGFKITSSANCTSRKAYISQTYQIPLESLRCTKYSYTCGGTSYYWLLEVDSDAAIAASSEPEVASAIPAALAC